MIGWNSTETIFNLQIFSIYEILTKIICIPFYILRIIPKFRVILFQLECGCVYEDLLDPNLNGYSTLGFLVGNQGGCNFWLISF